MTVTCVLNDPSTTSNPGSITLGSVDGTKITAVTNATGAPTRTINGADLNLGVQNVNNVGLTVSAFLTMQANVLEPSGSGSTVGVASHPTNALWVIVTIATVAVTLIATELKDAIANCLRNS